MTKAWQFSDPRPEDRLLGLDRDLILPALAIVAVTAFMAYGIPAIDRSIPAIEFEPGVAQVVHDRIEFIPGPGWIADGVPAPSSPELKIFKEGVAVTIAPGLWSGTADELLTSILNDYPEYHTEGDRRAFTLPSGLEGVAINLYGVDTDGAVFALIAPDAPAMPVDDRIDGVRLVVEGPSEVLPELTGEITSMVRSIKPVEPQSGEAAE